MKKIVIALLAGALVIVVVYVFVTKEPRPTDSRPAPGTASRDAGWPVSRPPEPVPTPPARELPAQKSSQEPAASHTPEAGQGPEAVPSSPAAEESGSVLPKDHIAWSQERQMRELLEMSPDHLAKFRADYREVIGGELAREAKIDLTPDEVERLTDVFMDATIDFCRQWHPILKEGLEQPGKARDRLAMLNAVKPDMLLMLYAIPARQNEISKVVGADRYERMHSVVKGEFQKCYDSLTNKAETIQQRLP